VRRSTLILFVIAALAGCKKDPQIIPDNDPPYYGDVPTVLIRNYINRMYIDLIGREPLDTEMDADLEFLRDEDLSWESRDSLLRRLQFDTTWIEGDTSYKQAYFHRFYEMSKGRFIEGAPNSEIQLQYGITYFSYVVDSLNGDWVAVEQDKIMLKKWRDILESERNYRIDTIEHWEMHTFMIDNPLYDQINMNTFNFINATFDDLFHRFPTDHEFTEAFDIIEYNESGTIFGQAAQNKQDYIDILVQTKEYYEGMVIWAYTSLLSREPSTAETFKALQKYYNDHDFQWVQRQIMATDEYANF
jgi:hypothetical protein